MAVWTGTYTATVVNNDDPLGVGRLQLNVPQVLGNAVSSWAVPAAAYYQVPNNGTTLSCVFLGGDPAQPAWNGPLDLSPLVESAAPPTVTYSSSPPPNPRVNDIWYEELGGVQVAPQVWTFNSGTSTFSWVTQGALGNPAIGSGQVQGGAGSGTNNIASGTITANEIHANSLTSSVIGNLGLCLNANPFFSGGSTAGWVAGSTSTIVGTVTGGSLPAGATYGTSSYAIEVTMGTGASGKLSDLNEKFGVIVGSRYILTAWVYSTAAITLSYGFDFRNSGGAIISGVGLVTSAIAANTWTLVSVPQTAPATAVTANMEFEVSAATTLYIQAAQAFPQVPGIVDATTINAATFIGTNWIENIFGMFLYSGTPAAGNLLASIAPVSGNDAAWTSGAGNAYLAGIVSYQQGTSPCVAVEITTASINWYTSATSAGPWSETISLQQLPGSPVGLSIAPPTGGYIELNGNVLSTGGTPASPTTITTDTWNNVTPPTSWSGRLRYRMTTDTEVEIDCLITGTTAINGQLTLFNLPSTPTNYVPSNGFYFPIVTTISGVTSAAAGLISGAAVEANVNSNTTRIAFTQRVPLN